MGVVLGAPFNSGILVTGPVEGCKYQYGDATEDVLDKVRRIQGVCESHGVPMPAAALQFPLGWDNVASIIPGAKNATEAATNAEWMNLEIPTKLWDNLKDDGLLREDCPVPAS